LTHLVFLGTEVRLEIGFSSAQARLVNLTRGGLLRRACGDAYHELGTGLARVGPLGATAGLSKLVTVRFSDMTIRDNLAIMAIRWEAAGPGGVLFPALDADIRLTPDRDDATMLAVSGVYRPPLGRAGASLDRVIMHRVAQTTIRAFTGHIAAAITHPAASPEPGHTGALPEPSPWPEPGTLLTVFRRSRWPTGRDPRRGDMVNRARLEPSPQYGYRWPSQPRGPGGSSGMRTPGRRLMAEMAGTVPDSSEPDPVYARLKAGWTPGR
jgi:hypothetical protein